MIYSLAPKFAKPLFDEPGPGLFGCLLWDGRLADRWIVQWRWRFLGEKKNQGKGRSYHRSVRSTHLPRWVEHHVSAISLTCSFLFALCADDTVRMCRRGKVEERGWGRIHSVVCIESTRRKIAACVFVCWIVTNEKREVADRWCSTHRGRWVEEHGSVVRSPLPLILLLPQKSSTSLDDSLKFTK